MTLFLACPIPLFIILVLYFAADKLWPQNTVRLFLDLYKERRFLCDGTQSTVRHDTLYAEISQIMALLLFERTPSAKQCYLKMDTMKGTFKAEYDECRRTGAAPSQWEWYEEMLPLFEGTATLEPPYSYSGGTSNEYSVGGKIQGQSSRSTRTRPPAPLKSAKSAAKEPKARKPVFRNQALELQERGMQLQAQNAQALVQEVRLMREGSVKYREQSLAILGSFINSIKKP